MQKYVRYMFKKLQKCLRKVSEVINLLENYHFQICKTVRILSEISLLTDFWYFYDFTMKHSQETFVAKNCQKTVKWYIYDTFVLLEGNILRAKNCQITVKWHISDAILQCKWNPVKRPILYLSSSIVYLASNASDGQMTLIPLSAAIKSELKFWT